VRLTTLMQGSENCFVAGYEDGTLVVYDKDKEDQTFTYSAYDGSK
jgi:hypothetical protein